MAERGTWSIATTGVGPQVAVGERVNVPTNERGDGTDVVPDPEGKFVVTACEPGLIEVRRIDEP